MNGITFGAQSIQSKDSLKEFLDPYQQYQDTQTWDVGTVLLHLKTIPTTKNARLKDLKIPNGYVNVFNYFWANVVKLYVCLTLNRKLHLF